MTVKQSRFRWPRVTRDTVTFASGLAGVFHETLIGKADRPYLLFLFASMIGLPLVFRQDEKQ